MQMSSVSTQHSYETLMVGVSDECLTMIVTSRLNIAAIDSSEMQALLLYLSQWRQSVDIGSYIPT